MDIDLTINGQRRQAAGVPDDLTLLEFLQEDLGLTGTKFCCGIGVCRACTVIAHRVPGAPPVPVLSCSTPVSQVNGQTITTVEGLASADGKLSKLQQAFLDDFAFQCGYCTPGFLMAAQGLIERLRVSPVRRDQLDSTIRGACGDHICRCTGYVRYQTAIRKAVLAESGLVTGA